MDLIEVSPNAEPPVCRIDDHGRLKFQANKRERIAKKGQKTNDLKEIRLRPNIDSHDLASKTAKVKQFIEAGHKVKLTVRFRGRELAHQNLGLDLLRRIANDMKDTIRLEAAPSTQGRSITMTVIPAKRDTAPETKPEPGQNQKTE